LFSNSYEFTALNCFECRDFKYYGVWDSIGDCEHYSRYFIIIRLTVKFYLVKGFVIEAIKNISINSSSFIIFLPASINLVIIIYRRFRIADSKNQFSCRLFGFPFPLFTS